MRTLKHKHLTLEDRYVIQEYLSHGYSSVQIGNRLNKSRRTIAKEVLKHRILKILKYNNFNTHQNKCTSKYIVLSLLSITLKENYQINKINKQSLPELVNEK